MISASYFRYKLVFKKPVKTSRGSMGHHEVYYIELRNGARTGYGEAAPLKGLSIDDRPDFEQKLSECIKLVNDGLPPDALNLKDFPSLGFAFETATLSLQHTSPFTVFDNSFVQGSPIAINGLVWMNTREEMLHEAFNRIEQGFDCIKFKVGALDFDEECRMLEAFRKKHSAFKAAIRLDANGAFANDEAVEKLKTLARFEVHSIEQPIKPGQPDYMYELCRKTTIPVALDEELIGVDVTTAGKQLLKQIQPGYIILKPTLIGGLNNADRWISHARQMSIGWWATSALESNIGLNAIAQWAAGKEILLQQGLGTGSLYTNNITSPLVVRNGSLLYDKNFSTWSFPPKP